MRPSQDPNVLAYRLERLRRAPRNWTFWIAAFTVLNGVFLAIKEDFMILAGLVIPFGFDGFWPHFIAAAMLAVAGYVGTRVTGLLWAAGAVYLVDTAFAAYAGIWSGVAMHVVVLVLVSIALNGLRVLGRQQASPPEGETK
jgi:hypothetical protein